MYAMEYESAKLWKRLEKPAIAKPSNQRRFFAKISTQNFFCVFDLDQVDPISTIFYKCLTKIAIFAKI